MWYYSCPIYLWNKTWSSSGCQMKIRISLIALLMIWSVDIFYFWYTYIYLLCLCYIICVIIVKRIYSCKIHINMCMLYKFMRWTCIIYYVHFVCASNFVPFLFKRHIPTSHTYTKWQILVLNNKKTLFRIVIIRVNTLMKDWSFEGKEEPCPLLICHQTHDTLTIFTNNFNTDVR